MFIALGILIMIMAGLFLWRYMREGNSFQYFACGAFFVAGVLLFVLQFVFT